MNEQIKYIAIECAGALDWDPPKDPKEYTFTPTELSKFAELIIQKCKSQLALIGITNFENKDITWTVETAIVNIEEHFGVKK